MKYLITGGTGDIGSRVVAQLLQRAERPRVFVRDAEKARARFADRVEIAVGDLQDASSLRMAFEGIDSIFLVNSGPELSDRDSLAADVAKAAGVKHLVKLSSMDSLENVGTGVWHAKGELAIRNSGLQFTFVQPAGFMSNARWWAGQMKAEGAVHSMTGEGKIPFIHSDDIAAVATEALTTQKYFGSAIAITGPVALSYGEMAWKIGAAINKKIASETLSEDQERRKMERWGESQEMIEAHLSIYRAIRDGQLAAVTDGVERVLGRLAIPFDQWVTENVATFR